MYLHWLLVTGEGQPCLRHSHSQGQGLLLKRSSSFFVRVFLFVVCCGVSSLSMFHAFQFHTVLWILSTPLVGKVSKLFLWHWVFHVFLHFRQLNAAATLHFFFIITDYHLTRLVHSFLRCGLCKLSLHVFLPVFRTHIGHVNQSACYNLSWQTQATLMDFLPSRYQSLYECDIYWTQNKQWSVLRFNPGHSETRKREKTIHGANPTDRVEVKQVQPVTLLRSQGLSIRVIQCTWNRLNPSKPTLVTVGNTTRFLERQKTVAALFSGWKQWQHSIFSSSLTAMLSIEITLCNQLEIERSATLLAANHCPKQSNSNRAALVSALMRSIPSRVCQHLPCKCKLFNLQKSKTDWLTPPTPNDKLVMLHCSCYTSDSRDWDLKFCQYNFSGLCIMHPIFFANAKDPSWCAVEAWK